MLATSQEVELCGIMSKRGRTGDDDGWGMAVVRQFDSYNILLLVV